MRHPLLLLILLLSPLVTRSAPWPGEPWQQAQVLTHLDDDFGKNLSGAHWNPQTRTLWVCVNAPGKFLALVEDGAGSFKVDTRNGQRGEFAPGGDLEGLTQADLAEQAVYVMAEGEDIIRKYDTSVYGAVRLLQAWSIKPFVPTSGGAGSEGIAFVPDTALIAAGFVNKAGTPYKSTLGMGGLMFVAHQNGGGIYAFDLSPTSQTSAFVGAYKTSRTESSGLEFDRSTGKLYVWHNLGSNYLEVVSLASDALPDGSRKLRQIVEYDGPKAGNLEGVALTPATAREHGAFLADDDNQDGAALMRFQRFAPGLTTLDVRIAASADDAEESVTGTVNLTSTDLELVQDGSTQTVGIRFPSVPIPPGVHVLKAHLQFGTDEVTSAATSLTIRGQVAASAPPFLVQPKNLSARVKTTAVVTWAPAPWAVVGEVGANQRTPDISPVVREIVALPGWTAGGSMVFLITGSGKRVAEAFNGDPSRAPLLHVEFEP